MTLVQTIMNQICSDDCDKSDRLREFYEHASEVERAAIDEAFTYLCGWRLKTLSGESTETAVTE